MPKVAVLLAAYNGMAFIKLQLESILKQKGVLVSVFISVDKSSDGTFEWCTDISKNDDRVSVLADGESFGGAAPNFFRLIRDVNFADFDLVALSDQDDIWLEDKLITAYDSMKENNVDAYSSNVMAFWDNGQQLIVDKAQAQRKYDYLFEAAGPGCTYVLASLPLQKFKEHLLKKKQLANQITLHDWLIYAFFRANNYGWYIDGSYKMLYRQHQSNQVGVNKGMLATLKRFELFKSGWYRQQVEYVSQFIDFERPDFSSKYLILKNILELRRKLIDRVVLFFFVLLGIY
ncbi:MAG: rhamnosyltransferase [Enterobacterales bacterium]|jgi:rhamnosyltransferase